MEMLRVLGLNCGYGNNPVLAGIDFQVQSGKILGIIGPNGSGKTTLLRAISRAIVPKKGKILLDSIDIQTISAKDLAKTIAVVSQNSSLDELTVEEFILLGRIPYYGVFQFFETKKDLEATQKAMQLTGTIKIKDRMLRHMSDGEKQLVLIARALAQEPKLILLDEPTAHLDITHQASILNLIRKLNTDFGLTVIMVMHDLNLASEYCHDLLLINNGRIHKMGYPGEIFNCRDIEEVYKIKVLIENNPVSQKPYIILAGNDGAY